MGVISDLNFDWTRQREAQLEGLWATGLSAAQIAKEMGCNSRGAIIGKAHRLNLPSRIPGPIALSEEERYQRSKERQEKKNAQRRLRRAGKLPPRTLADNGRDSGTQKRLQRLANASQISPAPVPEPDPEPIDDLAIPEKQRRTIMQLTDETCRWPVGNPGDPGFFFCGAPPKGDHPYCAAHCVRAFNPRAPRREHRPYRGA